LQSIWIYRALTVQLLRQFMVLSGLTFQRVVTRAVFLLFYLVAFSSARGQASDVAGTMPEDYLPQLKQILAAATERPPHLIESLFLIEAREAGRISANAARLPSLGSNINYGSTELSESGDSSTRSRDQGLFYNVGLNQAIFHWGALKNQSAIARIHLLLA
jgi:outer membrane protein TolC